MLFDTVLGFDHVQHRILLIANARITGRRGPGGALSVRVRPDPVPGSGARAQPVDGAADAGRRRVDAELEHDAGGLRGHRSGRAKEHIAAGDIYQVVLSQRFEAEVERRSVHGLSRAAPRESVALHVLHAHRRARRSSARRRRCWCASKAAASRRIRSPAPARAAATSEEDMRLAEELKRNEKERAEHVMLVDLGRNDVGRVCEYGSVRVPKFMALERFSHVMHLVSVVEGTLAEDARSARCAGVVLPGRHGVRRAEGPRDGDHHRASSRRAAASTPARSGYLDFAGNLDFCIAIRTIVLDGRQGLRPGRRGHRRRLESGGGVPGNVGQGAGDGASPGARAAGLLTKDAHGVRAWITTIRSPTTWSSTSASWARGWWCDGTTR